MAALRVGVGVWQATIISLILLLMVAGGEGLRCIQCEAGGGNETCLEEPERCQEDMTVCMAIRTYSINKNDTRRLISLVRTCGPTDMGHDCERGQMRKGLSVEVCYDTCSWDGCNHSPGLSFATPLLLLSLLLWVSLI